MTEETPLSRFWAAVDEARDVYWKAQGAAGTILQNVSPSIVSQFWDAEAKAQSHFFSGLRLAVEAYVEETAL